MIDIIGILYEPSIFDMENPVAPVPLTGWHVNVTPDEMSPALEPFRVEPSPLSRVWAGDDPVHPVTTIPLRFASEAEALTFFPPKPKMASPPA